MAVLEVLVQGQLSPLRWCSEVRQLMLLALCGKAGDAVGGVVRQRDEVKKQ